MGPCDSCSLWYHIDCIGMGEEEYDLLLTQSFDWLCSSCETSGEQQENITLNSQSNQVDAEQQKKPNKRKSRTNNRDSMKILLINFQSIKNKSADLEQLIYHHQPDIIQGTETWLNPDISSSEIFPSNYTVFRRDRKTDDHGGVIFACKKDIIVTERKEFSSESEMLWHQIELKGRSSILLGTVYKPKHNDAVTVDNLQNVLTKINHKLPNNNIIVCGDFNQPNVDWNNLCTIPSTWACSKTANKLINVTVENGLDQVVDKPTRGNNILDLVLTNNTNVIRKIEVEPGLGDHEMVRVELDLKLKRKKANKRKVFIRQKADEKGIKEDILQFQQKFRDIEDKPVQEQWDCLEEEIKNTMDRRVPSKSSSTRHDLPWFGRKHRRLTRCKQRLYYKAKASGLPEDWERYKVIQKTTRRSLQRAKRGYISDHLANNIKDNPKAFWTFVKKTKSEEVGISDLKVNNSVISDAKGKAEALNNQFASVFTQENTDEIPTLDTEDYEEVPRLIISSEGVLKQLKNLAPNKAPGPDQLPPWFLKIAAEELAPILTNIFQSSVDNGILPRQWREANIIGIFKKGDKSKPENYRPVSLTSIICKILEHIIHSHVMKHLEKLDILVDKQHGFRAKRSTVTQLLQTTHDFTSNLEESLTTHLAILDFSKAFDKVPHERLLSKLNTYGIRNSLLAWIRNFLTQRTQQVVCDGEKSVPKKVISGVPQGTVLGPLLFLLYINDLPSGLSSSVRLFADDCLVYSAGKDNHHITKLQEDLNKLQEWQDMWMMSFNPGKCYTMEISYKKDPPTQAFTFCGQELQMVDSQPYLGVEIDNKMTWSVHIKNTISKANRVLGLIRRNFWYCTTDVKVCTYKMLVRPILEYASVVWDPRTHTHKHRLEMVQRRAARFCSGDFKKYSSVTEMLNNLDWETLEQRRKNDRLTMLYKVSHGLVGINGAEYLTHSDNRRTRGSHQFKYQRQHKRLDVHKYSFFNRTIPEWNELPDETTSAPSLDIFKQRLHN